MGLLQRLLGSSASEPVANPVRAETYDAPAVLFHDLSNPDVVEYLRGGLATGSGQQVSTEAALRNPTVFRCLDLICGSVAMLPFNLHRETENGDFVKATGHPLHRVLRRRPNAWQTPFEFKGLMQYRALVHDKGAAALIVKSRGRIVELLPLNPDRVDIELSDENAIQYTYSRKAGGRIRLDPSEVLHLRGLTFDGVNGLSRVRKAAEAIGIAIAAERATASLFKNGTFASGALTIPGELSEEAFERLKASWNGRHSGADNAGTTPLLEGGTKYENFAMSARDAQSAESRRFQVEEILRVFGVPRPLAMMDDTGWGSGIEQLSIGFVRFGLNPWFRAWEEAVNRSCLGEGEDDYEAKFNPAALLNGTMKDQYDAFAKASGAGGHKPWMTANEIRKLLNQPRHPDGDGLERAGAPVSPSADDEGDTVADDAAEQLLKGRKAKTTEGDDEN